MIFATAAALAAAPIAHEVPEAATKACPQLVTPEALVCRALEAKAQGNSQSAAEAFEEAAKASSQKGVQTARLWAAAGNMWIAANQPGKAASALDKALELPGLRADQRGEALLDRARAAEAKDDLRTARTKITEAAAFIPADPFYWYFSAALAIRENDLVAAQAAIDKALALAPSDQTILFEAGHVAHLRGDDGKARSYWADSARADPRSDIGKEAARAAELLGVTPVLAGQTPPPSR